MTQTIRAFIALELESSIQKLVHRIQNNLKNKIDGKIAWVKPENAHITLKFLGDIRQDQAVLIIDTLNTIQRPSSIALTAESLGIFPSEGPPKVIWIGFDDAENFVQSLFAEIENKLSALGFPKETRAFQNHLTLGRIKSLKDDSNLRNLLNKEELIRHEKFRVEKLTFFQSILKSDGAVYKAIN